MNRALEETALENAYKELICSYQDLTAIQKSYISDLESRLKLREKTIETLKEMLLEAKERAIGITE